MTPMDVEVMVRNLNQRVTSIEQILPTLATRQDLKSGLDDLRRATKTDLEIMKQELREEMATKRDLAVLREQVAVRFDEAKRYALVLHEDLKSDIGLVAEHLADVMSRLPPRER